MIRFFSLGSFMFSLLCLKSKKTNTAKNNGKVENCWFTRDLKDVNHKRWTRASC